jgi:hypothetical protein
MSEGYPHEMQIKIDRTAEQDRLLRDRDELNQKLALAQRAQADLEERLEQERNSRNNAFEEDKKKDGANGVVRLQNTEGGRYINPQEDPNHEQGFDDWTEAIRYLKDQERMGNKNAKNTLNALWLKSINSSDKPEVFELSGTLWEAVNGKAKFVKKNHPSDPMVEDAELQA